MANIKLDKNVIVCFRFIVAGESRLLVVLQFSFFFAVRFSCEKRTLLLMLNFNNYCLSLGQEGGGVSKENVGSVISTSVTSRHTSVIFNMAGEFVVRYRRKSEKFPMVCMI